VYYYFGGFENLRTHLGLKTRKLTSPQGFPVDSHQELFVSKYFFARGIPAERKVIKLKNGRNLHPDFIIFDNGSPVVIEDTMVESIDCFNSSREEKYAAKLEAKINTYNENNISHIIVTPSQINIKSLDSLFLKFQKNGGEKKAQHKGDNLDLGFLSPVYWTLEKIEKEIIRVSKKCDGNFPTQSELKKFGKPGIVNAIYKNKKTLNSMQLRMGLPVRPNLPTRVYRRGEKIG